MFKDVYQKHQQESAVGVRLKTRVTNGTTLSLLYFSFTVPYPHLMIDVCLSRQEMLAFQIFGLHS